MKFGRNALCRLGALIFLISLTLPTRGNFLDNILKDDEERVTEYYNECLEIIEFGVGNSYEASCFKSYHHFNTSISKYYKRSHIKDEVRISSFNMLNPGAGSSFFKDYEILAKIINNYDLVTAQELLPLVSKDQRSNQRILKFLKKSNKELLELVRRRDAESDFSLEDEIEKLKKTMIKARSLYRVPGYLKILSELRKTDPSWSLILSPAGDSAKRRSIHEFVGFFYRGSTVAPKINEHCQKFSKKSFGMNFACFPSFGRGWLGRNVRQVFSRRPFMGSFISGSFDFTIITTHVSFNAPKEVDRRDAILAAAFNVTDFDNIGEGVNSVNYARFAEVKVILEIMSKVRDESKEKDMMFMGDLNLESSNPYWRHVLPLFPNMEIYVDEPTTISSQYRRNDGSKTNGLASNFDHVLIDPTVSKNCLSHNGDIEVSVDSFITDSSNDLFNERYLLREHDSLRPLYNSGAKKVHLLKLFDEYVESLYTIKRNKIALDFSKRELEEDTQNFKRRILDEQFQEATFYKIYKEVISDHLPISFKCKTR